MTIGIIKQGNKSSSITNQKREKKSLEIKLRSEYDVSTIKFFNDLYI
jgi:hypothetical protein